MDNKLEEVLDSLHQANLVTDNVDLLVANIGGYNALRTELKEYFVETKLELARMEAYIGRLDYPSAQITENLNKKATQIRKNSRYFGFVDVVVACGRFLQENDLTTLHRIREDFKALESRLLPTLGPMNNLDGLMSQAVAEVRAEGLLDGSQISQPVHPRALTSAREKMPSCPCVIL